MKFMTADQVDYDRITVPAPEGTRWRVDVPRGQADMPLGWGLVLERPRRWWFPKRIGQSEVFPGMLKAVMADVDPWGEEGTYYALNDAAKYVVDEARLAGRL